MRNLWGFLIIATFLAVSVSGLLLLSGGEEDGQGEVVENDLGTVFEENDDIYLYVGLNGNAEGRMTGLTFGKEINQVMKISILNVGIEKMEKTFMKSIRRSLASVGTEMDDCTCDIEGLDNGAPIKISMSWDIPNLAEWNENHWEISFDGVDDQAVARQTFSEIEDSWVAVRNISQAFGLSNVRYRVFTQTHIVLPEGTQDASFSPSGEISKAELGGGNQTSLAVYSKTVEDRTHVIENKLSVIVAENKITESSQILLEDPSSFHVTYKTDNSPDWSFMDLINSVRLDLKYGRSLKEYYNFSGSGPEGNRLSPAQILYYTTQKIVAIENGDELVVQNPPDLEVASWGESDFEASRESISKEEYLEAAKNIRENLRSLGEVAGPMETEIGGIGIRDMLYTFARALAEYEEHGSLPEELRFMPSPHGYLNLEGNEVSAKIPYFLLSSTDVVIGTEKVENILSQVSGSNESWENLAKRLSDWAHESINYDYKVFGRTSEEILDMGRGRCADYTNVYLALLRTAGIPSRRVSGWVVSDWEPPTGWEFIVGETPEGKAIAGHAWSQVYLPGEGWISVDPTHGYFENLPYEIYRSIEQTWIDSLAAYESEYGPL